MCQPQMQCQGTDGVGSTWLRRDAICGKAVRVSVSNLQAGTRAREHCEYWVSICKGEVRRQEGE